MVLTFLWSCDIITLYTLSVCYCQKGEYIVMKIERTTGGACKVIDFAATTKKIGEDSRNKERMIESNTGVLQNGETKRKDQTSEERCLVYLNT